mmetsp:Transcript_43015/g.63037  ORF Transcript_43015/g.63037 Transcript_43015/m.63037 type:complete len:99 (+) Transcript_43015:287-583(+)
MTQAVLFQHKQAEHSKLTGSPYGSPSPEENIHAINSLHKLPIPFTVDPLGCFGPLPSLFLHDPKTPTTPFPAPWTTHLTFRLNLPSKTSPNTPFPTMS